MHETAQWTYRLFLIFLWAVTLIFVIVIAISMSGQSLLVSAFEKPRIKKLCGVLGEISLSVYLIHGTVHTMYAKWFENPYVRYANKYSFVLLSLLCSTIHWFITPRVAKLCTKVISTIKVKMLA